MNGINTALLKKKARDKKATKELYERLDTLTLDDIRKEYLHPLEEEENDK